MSSKQANLASIEEKTRQAVSANIPISNSRPIAYKKHPMENEDSDDDVAVLATFRGGRAYVDPNNNRLFSPPPSRDTDSEYVVLSHSNTFALEYNATFYGVQDDALELDPLAPYYSESLINWLLGTAPVNPNGTKVYTIKLKNIMTEEVLQRYIDSGVTLLQVNSLKVQVVPQQFTVGTLGTATLKIVQGNYFDTQIAKIQDEFITEVSEEITGTTFNIATDRPPIAQLLETSIAIVTYRWINTVIISNKPSDGTNVNLSMMLTAELTPSTGNPFRVNSSISGNKSNQADDKKQSAQKKMSQLPAKFL